MQSKSKRILSLLLISLFVIPFLCSIYSGPVLAETFWEQQEGMSGSQTVGEAFGHEYDDPDDVRLIAARIIKIALSFIGIIFVILLIIAGYKWMTASGNESKVDEAKKQIGNAVIGLIVVMAAYSVTYFVTKAIFDASM